MLTKGSRKDPAPKVPEDGPFLDDTAPDPGSDPTVEHGGSWNFDASESTSGDPYNTTGRFTLDDEPATKLPATPEVPKIVARR